MREIDPMRIFLFDKLNFPFAVPFLQLLLSRYCGERIVKDLKVHELVNVILFRKASHGLQLVLVSATNKVVCNSNVQRAMLSAGQNINKVLFIHVSRSVIMDSGSRFARPE